MKKTRLTAAERYLADAYENVGVRAEVTKDIPRWPKWTLIRIGDGMCIAEGFTSKWATWFLDGFKAALQYPPKREVVGGYAINVMREGR